MGWWFMMRTRSGSGAPSRIAASAACLAAHPHGASALGHACACVQAGESPLQMGPKAEVSGCMNSNPLSFALRLLLGTAAGFYYFVVPVYMYIKNLIVPKDQPL